MKHFGNKCIQHHKAINEATPENYEHHANIVLIV